MPEVMYPRAEPSPSVRDPRLEQDLPKWFVKRMLSVMPLAGGREQIPLGLAQRDILPDRSREFVVDWHIPGLTELRVTDGDDICGQVDIGDLKRDDFSRSHPRTV